MSVSIATHSHLRFAELVTVDGVEFWDLPELPEIPQQPDDIRHEVISTDRLDLLATKYYGDPICKWIIAVANDLECLPLDLQVGTVLRIPAPRYVLQDLFKRARG